MQRKTFDTRDADFAEFLLLSPLVSDRPTAGSAVCRGQRLTLALARNDFSLAMDEFLAPFPVSPVEHHTQESDLHPQNVPLEQQKVSTPATPPAIPLPLTSKIPPANAFSLEVVKSGSSIGKMELTSSRIVFGRATDADIVLEHPSVSRYHAVLLWNPDEGSNSFILRDLKSSHGTYANKDKMPAGSSIKLMANNSLIGFGGSSRLYFLNSTLPDEAPADTGCDWGQKRLDQVHTEEAVDDEPEAEFELIQSLLTAEEITSSANEEAFAEDPHKTLVKWLEHEGYGLQLETINKDGFFVTTIQLPIEGRDFEVTGTPQSKKKDAITNACLLACRLLDKSKRLFPWQRTNDATAKRPHEEDEEEEEVLDETVKAKKTKSTNVVHTFDSLTNDWNTISAQVITLKAKLAGMTSGKKQDAAESSDADSLDQFMNTVSDEKESTESKIHKSKLRLEIKQLEKEQEKISRLLKAATPSTSQMPALISNVHKALPRIQSLVKEETKSSKQEAEEEVKSETPAARVEKEEEVEKNKLQSKDDESSSKIKFKLPFPKSKAIVKSETMHKINSVGQSLTKLKESTKPKSTFKPSSDDFVEWLPPENQDGSGRTSLNDKLGY